MIITIIVLSVRKRQGPFSVQAQSTGTHELTTRERDGRDGGGGRRLEGQFTHGPSMKGNELNSDECLAGWQSF
jgi:hypothetical protein